MGVKRNKERIVDKHLEFKRTSVKSENKIKDIKWILNLFFNSSKLDPSKFYENEVVKFINLISKKYSVRTQNDFKVVIKGFVKWFYPDYFTRFPNLDKICKIQKPEKARKPEDILSLKEIEMLINAEKDLFWKVFLLVFFYGGFRPGEACRLKWIDVTFEKDGTIIKTFSKKNNKTFYKSLPDDVTFYLKEWREKNDSEWMFPSKIKDNCPIMVKTFNRRIGFLSEKTLGKRIFPYILRHSFATLKYNERGLDDGDVANQLGHSKSMKETYTTLNLEQTKANARRIWAKAKELPPEKKHELELEIEKLKQQNKDFEPYLEMFKNLMSDCKSVENHNPKKELEVSWEISPTFKLPNGEIVGYDKYVTEMKKEFNKHLTKV